MHASSFFFARAVSGRNRPQRLFTTMVRDLAGLSPAFAENIALSLEEERSIASAPPTGQFEALILNPSRRHPFTKPAVIVIDALDEGLSDNFDTGCLRPSSQTLRNVSHIPHLPTSKSIWRIFVAAWSYSNAVDRYTRTCEPEWYCNPCSIEIEGNRDVGKSGRELARPVSIRRFRKDGGRPLYMGVRSLRLLPIQTKNSDHSCRSAVHKVSPRKRWWIHCMLPSLKPAAGGTRHLFVGMISWWGLSW